MTDRLAAMRAGRKRAARERERASIARVRAYTAWLKTGSDLRRMPEVPTDADYAVMRRRDTNREETNR